MTDWTREELAETAAMLRRLLDAVAGGSLGDSAPTRYRMEGAVATMEALAAGRMPSVDDLGEPTSP